MVKKRSSWRQEPAHKHTSHWECSHTASRLSLKNTENVYKSRMLQVVWSVMDSLTMQYKMRTALLKGIKMMLLKVLQPTLWNYCTINVHTCMYTHTHTHTHKHTHIHTQTHTHTHKHTLHAQAWLWQTKEAREKNGDKEHAVTVSLCPTTNQPQ